MSQRLKAKARELGFTHVGIASVPPQSDRLPEVERLAAWLALGYHADMAWMADPRRQDVRRLMPDVVSIACVALNYYTPDRHSPAAEAAKFSRYGWGRDYHRVVGGRLKALSRWLEAQGEGICARWYVDAGPVAEKAWAQRAGIGWIGKHGNLITRDRGSWVFLGEILTNAELIPDRPHAQHCGTCTRCIEACPTQAIAQPFVVDANRCIAYHTIESKAPELPAEIATHLEGWVAGCDICQEVCPWNHRFAQPTAIADFQPRSELLTATLPAIESMDDRTWDRLFLGSALRRIKPDRLRRNARAARRAIAPPPAEDNRSPPHSALD